MSFLTEPIPEYMDTEDQKLSLFLRQKELLDTFLSHHAISQAQYDKSLGDLIVKMGITPSVLTKGDNSTQQ